MSPRKLEHGFRMTSAGIPYTSPSGHEDIDVPTFWLLLLVGMGSGLYKVSGSVLRMRL